MVNQIGELIYRSQLAWQANQVTLTLLPIGERMIQDIEFVVIVFMILRFAAWFLKLICEKELAEAERKREK